jgi:cyclophilin family peptidyl-prolyl cis-trans isomerase
MIYSRRLSLFALAALLLSTVQAQETVVNPEVEVQTTLGSFVIELDMRRAPMTVENFLGYVRGGHYQGTLFHRVIQGFIAQAGGYDANFKLKESEQSVANESGNGLSNLRGTVGLARANDPHSGNAQFYINLSNNNTLDPNPARWGYTVFGRIVKGMEVVDAIGHRGTGPGGPFDRDVPTEPISIEKIIELTAEQ